MFHQLIGHSIDIMFACYAAFVLVYRYLYTCLCICFSLSLLREFVLFLLSASVKQRTMP